MEKLISKRFALVIGDIPADRESSKISEHRCKKTATFPISDELEIYVSDTCYHETPLIRIFGRCSQGQKEKEFAFHFWSFFQAIPASVWSSFDLSSSIVDRMEKLSEICEARVRRAENIFSLWHLMMVVSSLQMETSLTYVQKFFAFVDLLLLSTESSDPFRELKAKLPVFINQSPYSLAQTYAVDTEEQIHRILCLRSAIESNDIALANRILCEFFHHESNAEETLFPSYFYDKVQTLNCIFEEIVQEVLKTWVLKPYNIKKLHNAEPHAIISFTGYSEKASISVMRKYHPICSKSKGEKTIPRIKAKKTKVSANNSTPK